MTRGERIVGPALAQFTVAAFNCLALHICVDSFFAIPNTAVRIFYALCAALNAWLAAVNLYGIPVRIRLALRFRAVKKECRQHFIESHGPEEGERLFRQHEFEKEGVNG